MICDDFHDGLLNVMLRHHDILTPFLPVTENDYGCRCDLYKTIYGYMAIPLSII